MTEERRKEIRAQVRAQIADHVQQDLEGGELLMKEVWEDLNGEAGAYDVAEDELRAVVAWLRDDSTVADATPAPCPNEDRCHGCAVWCDQCGDVTTVCDGPTCDRHFCNGCGEKVESGEDIYDGQAWCPSCVSPDL